MPSKTTNPDSPMNQATFAALIDFYIGDMLRRNCTPDSISTNRRMLERFERQLTTAEGPLRLADVTEFRVKEFVTAMQTRRRKWENHPSHPPVDEPLSPFTIRREVKTLRGFGTWLEHEGFTNPFGSLLIPKVPKYMVEVLTD